jgi:hypothetical protein
MKDINVFAYEVSAVVSDAGVLLIDDTYSFINVFKALCWVLAAFSVS